jgi:hypothetical protein
MMSSPHVTGDDLGNYFEDGEGRLWKMISYTDQPTAQFQLVDGDDDTPKPPRGRSTVDFVIGSANYNACNFARLVPQDYT